MFSHKIKTRVRYAETDQMGVVHHASYVIYFEEARTDALREWGISYSDIEKRGIYMPVVDIQIKYKIPSHYDEELTIVASIEEIPSSKMVFHYQTINEKNQLVNTGSTTLAFVNKETNRPCRIPDWLKDIIEKALAKK